MNENPLHTTVMTQASRTLRRRRFRLASMMASILLPCAAMGTYLYAYAADQYVSEFRFSVRQHHAQKMEAGGIASALGGGNPLMAAIADSEVVVQYLRSRQAVDDIGSSVDLRAIWSRAGEDFWASMNPTDTAERRLRHWRSVVDPYFDMTTGVVTVKVRAFRPEDAKVVASTALSAAEKLVNDMSVRAHSDALAYAEKQAVETEARLKRAETAIATYRNANAVLFPQMQAGAASTVETRLRGNLADARTTLSMLRSQGIHESSPQGRVLQTRISAMEEEISRVQGGITRSSYPNGSRAPLASILTGYSSLEVEEKISEKVYERALASLQDARSEAAQQQVYLDAFVRPALPEESLYPIRWRIMLVTALAGFGAWCLGMLMLHSIRDHID